MDSVVASGVQLSLVNGSLQPPADICVFGCWPFQIVGMEVYSTPACCPEGLLKYYSSAEDICCVDNVAENPYRCDRKFA